MSCVLTSAEFPDTFCFHIKREVFSLKVILSKKVVFKF